MTGLPESTNPGFRTGGKIFLSCSGDVSCFLRADYLNCLRCKYRFLVVAKLFIENTATVVNQRET